MSCLWNMFSESLIQKGAGTFSLFVLLHLNYRAKMCCFFLLFICFGEENNSSSLHKTWTKLKDFKRCIDSCGCLIVFVADNWPIRAAFWGEEGPARPGPLTPPSKLCSSLFLVCFIPSFPPHLLHSVPPLCSHHHHHRPPESVFSSRLSAPLSAVSPRTSQLQTENDSHWYQSHRPPLTPSSSSFSSEPASFFLHNNYTAENLHADKLLKEQKEENNGGNPIKWNARVGGEEGGTAPPKEYFVSTLKGDWNESVFAELGETVSREVVNLLSCLRVYRRGNVWQVCGRLDDNTSLLVVSCFCFGLFVVVVVVDGGGGDGVWFSLSPLLCRVPSYFWTVLFICSRFFWGGFVQFVWSIGIVYFLFCFVCFHFPVPGWSHVQI